MKLDLGYLNQRHDYWRIRIGEVGIWDADKFHEVTIKIRSRCRNYNALFIRRGLKRNNKVEIVDRIFIYNNVEDFEPKYLDSILVHEMIHQYIIQNGIKDTRTHGTVFRNYMKRINDTFGGELEIKISSKNPSLPDRGPGKVLHRLLVLDCKDCYWFCIIHPAKVSYFHKKIRREGKLLGVKKFYWAESNDIHFEKYRRCARSLHGFKKIKEEITEFCREFNIRPATYPVE